VEWLFSRGARRLRKTLWSATALWRAKRAGVVLGPENFCLAASLKPRVVLDVGTGHQPSFSAWVRSNGDAFVILCDPTPKHRSALAQWVAADGNGVFLELALSPVDGPVEFFESASQESGSLVGSHRNRSTGGRSVVVQGVSLPTLLTTCMRYGSVQLVKTDVEGSEFSVFTRSADMERALLMVEQWLVEFHPVPQTRIPFWRVLSVVRQFKQLGFRAFTPNGVDYLFWRP